MFILFIIIINNKFKIKFKNKTFKWLYLLSKEIISTYFNKLIHISGFIRIGYLIMQTQLIKNKIRNRWVANSIHRINTPPLGSNGPQRFEFLHEMRKLLLNLAPGEPFALVKELHCFDNSI